MSVVSVTMPERRLYQQVLDLGFPPRCVGCASPGAWICRRCWSSVSWLPPDRCIECSSPLESAGLCPLCLQRGSSIGGGRINVTAVARFEGIARKAVHELKYKGHRDVATVLGPVMAQRVDLGVATIVSVPLHWKRKRSRGYNQSELLARNIAGAMGCRVDASSLRRQSNTRDQIRLDAAARRANVAGVFLWTGGKITGPVLIVDDVYTTGATLNACADAVRRAACADAVRRAGATPVEGVVFACDLLTRSGSSPE